MACPADIGCSPTTRRCLAITSSLRCSRRWPTCPGSEVAASSAPARVDGRNEGWAARTPIRATEPTEYAMIRKPAMPQGARTADTAAGQHPPAWTGRRARRRSVHIARERAAQPNRLAVPSDSRLVVAGGRARRRVAELFAGVASTMRPTQNSGSMTTPDASAGRADSKSRGWNATRGHRVGSAAIGSGRTLGAGKAPLVMASRAARERGQHAA